MAKATLTDGIDGDVIDIHCGGVDLKFPHHENEIAQSCCANAEEKKSLGNVTLVHDLLKEWDGEVIRLALLKAHYRSELSWSEDLLKASKAQLDGWYRVKALRWESKTLKAYYSHDFAKFMDDINTPGLLSEIQVHFDDLAAYIRSGDDRPWEHLSTVLLTSANLLGLLQKDPAHWFKGNASSDDQAEFDAIAKRRELARAAKDWAAADAARDEATAKGIVLEDSPDGTTWRKA